MAESTTTTKITEAEWRAAREAGLLFAAPGTNAQDAAIHKFAEAIRRPALIQESIEVIDSLLDYIGESNAIRMVGAHEAYQSARALLEELRALRAEGGAA